MPEQTTASPANASAAGNSAPCAASRCRGLSPSPCGGYSVARRHGLALPRLPAFAAVIATAVLMLGTVTLPLEAQEAKRRQKPATKADAATKPEAAASKAATKGEVGTAKDRQTDAADRPSGQSAESAAEPATAADGAAAATTPAPQDETAQALLANSPFMSKAFKERLAKSDNNRTRDLVFRGFAGDAGNWLICVYNNKSKESRWVRLGEQIDGITIAEFDLSAMRIKVVKDATSTFLNLESQR